MNQPIWLTEQDVVGLLDLREAIAALEAALRQEAAGAAANMTKTLLQYGKANLHAIGGKLGNLVGTKSWVHTEDGTCPLLLLWDAADGSLVAVIEAFALGNLRTGGISGVATDWMAAPEARAFAIIGTGKQSLSQVGAVLAVRPIEELRVFSPRPESRAAFAAKAREEFAQDVFARASRVAVDNIAGVQKLSREFITRYGSGDWSAVQPLSQLIAAGRKRALGDDVSLFKAMGMGISDLALGTELVRRARERGVGRTLAQPKKAKPRLTRSKETT